MLRARAFRRLIGLTAVLTSAALSTVAGPAAADETGALVHLPRAQSSASAAMLDVTLSVRHVYVYDDGDKGSNCGDVDKLSAIKVIGGPSMSIDRGTSWSSWSTQSYCSDTGYRYESWFPAGVNQVSLKAVPGEWLAISGMVIEEDPGDIQWTGLWSYGSKKTKVPKAGDSAEFSLTVEGADGSEHLRMRFILRLITS